MFASATLSVLVCLSFAQDPQPSTPETKPAAGVKPAPATEAERPHDPPGVAWQRTLTDALAVQKATGLPLLIAVNMDGEVFNERFAGTTYRDPAFVRLTRDYVCVIASPDRHSERDYDALGNRIECPRFGGCTCSEHIAIEPELFDRYFNGNRNAPRHVGVDANGKILFDRFLDQSMQTAIDAIARYRGTATPKHLSAPDAAPGTAPDDVAELFRRRDAMARTLLENRYRQADRQQKAALLTAAGQAQNEPLDLLRMGIREADDELCGLAALALSRMTNAAVLVDIEDALARIDDGQTRQTLIARLREIGKDDVEAARMAANFEASAGQVPTPWRNEWAPAAFGDDMASIEARLDRLEATLKEQSDDQLPRLQLAVAQAAFAFARMREGGSGIELWLADARRNADRITDEALLPETRALQAITAWYGGDPAAAGKAAIEALAQGSSEVRPDPWLAENYLDVLLQATAQTAYGRAEQNAKASLSGEVARVRGILELLEARQGGPERGLLAGIGLLEFAGLRAEAQTRLAALVERHPASIAAHDRWRNRMLIDLGPEQMRAAYAKFATGAEDKPTAQWFAGYASLVAAERHTVDNRRIEGENAYGDAIERFLASADGNADYADSSHHYAVLALAGRAAIRQLRGNGRGAVDDLVRASELRPASLDEDDGLQRKPRAIAGRVAAELRSAGQSELAARLQPILP